MLIKELFGKNRIVGLVADKNQGKTNNLMALIKDFRKTNTETPIVVFGLNKVVIEWLNKHFKNIQEISSLNQLSKKRDCLIILEEYQLLHLNDRRYKEQLDKVIDFIYHNNNWVIFSSPNLREMNSILGSKIERFAVKSLKADDLVNGSQIKEKVLAYSGRYKSINDIVIDKDKMLIFDDDCERILTFEYIPEIDEKTKNKNIFDITSK